MKRTVKKFGRMVNKVTNDVTLMPFSIYRPFISLSERIPHVPSTVLYKFPKAVINNVCRGDAHRQLDECVPLAFNYRSILSVQKPLVVCPSARPSIGPVFRAQQHRPNPMAGTIDRADPYIQRSPNIYGGQSQISGVPRAPFD